MQNLLLSQLLPPSRPSPFEGEGVEVFRSARKNPLPLAGGGLRGGGKMQRISPKIKSNSRALRKNMTDVERMLWAKIRNRQLQGFRFRRQHPIGRYIVDFVCLELKLIIELDGGQHIDQQQYDTNRSQWLQTNGFKTVRFWNSDILDNLEGVMETICIHLPQPQHSSSIEGEAEIHTT